MEESAKHYVYAGMAAGAAASLVYYFLDKYGLSADKGADILRAFSFSVYGGLAGAVLGEAANGICNFSKKAARSLSDKVAWHFGVKRFMRIMPNGS